MKNGILNIFLLVFTYMFHSSSIVCQSAYIYEQSPTNIYGLPNPDAPQELKDFALLIGSSACTSASRKADQSWAEPVAMAWKFKYIMNGMAIQDETLKSDGSHAGSIRQYIPDSSRWFVHYYNAAAPSTILPTWEGNVDSDEAIIFYRDQKAPNGMDGYYKLKFYNIDSTGFKWEGAWVNKEETISFPTWKIDCRKTKID